MPKIKKSGVPVKVFGAKKKAKKKVKKFKVASEVSGMIGPIIQKAGKSAKIEADTLVARQKKKQLKKTLGTAKKFMETSKRLKPMKRKKR